MIFSVPNYIRTCFAILICMSFLRTGIAQKVVTADKTTIPLTRILFVFDASQSMSGTWESDEKFSIARQILIDIVDSLENVENVQMALRVYGHQSPVPPQDCSDTRLEVPFAMSNASRIREKLRNISPRGTTPIANSLALSADDFPPCNNCRNIIVLITDGIEACDGDPCAVSQELQQKGIVLKPFVIGIGLDPGFRETFDCVGYYYNALEEMKFKRTLDFVINQVLNSTTAQVNLLDEKGAPTETNVNMTFYDHYSNRVIYNYIHTINEKGNPDTLELDPLITYRLKIHTIPPVELDSISIIPGEHTNITLQAPQGYLVVKTSRGKQYDGQEFFIRHNKGTNTLHIQEIGQIEKYLTGLYEIEIPTIPRILINDIEIRQSHTTTIEIPEPGIVNFSSRNTGYGSIYSINDEGQEWIFNLKSSAKQQAYFIQPGVYKVVFRSSNSKSSLQTQVREFVVKSGQSIHIEV